MTVTVAPRYKRFNGNDTTGPFSFTFPILLSNSGTPYITVKRISSSGEETTLAYSTDYTFSALLLGKGGGIITTTVMVATGEQLFVEASTPMDQQISFRNQGEFSAESHENGFDKVHFILIENVQKADLSIKFPSSEIGVGTTLPVAALRANTTLGFDGSGDILCGAIATTIVSTPMIPVVQGATLADARTAMGLGSAATQASTAFDAAGAAAAAQAAAISSSVQKTGDTMSGNLDVPSLNGGPLSGMRNRIINGDFLIDQRNEGSSLTNFNGYPLGPDRWFVYGNVASKYSAQRLNATPPDGTWGYLRLTSLSAYGINSSDVFVIQQFIEGLNLHDLAYGTASAKTCALSFKARASVTGNYAVNLFNPLNNKSFVAHYNITQANVWQSFSIVVAGDTNHSMASDNSAGLYLRFSLGCGSSTQTATLNAWQSGNYQCASSSVAFVSTNAATLDITDIQFEVGSLATPKEQRGFNQELLLCQRYCYKTYEIGTALGSAVTGGCFHFRQNFLQTATGIKPVIYHPFPVRMRTVPAVTFYSLATGASGKLSDMQNGVDLTASVSTSGACGLSWTASTTVASSALEMGGHLLCSAE